MSNATNRNEQCIPSHRYGCSHEQHASLQCPKDETPLCYYDGALGYESYKCPLCGYDVNDEATTQS